MSTTSGETFPEEWNDPPFEESPETLAPTEQYLLLVKDILKLNGFEVIGELEFGGYEYEPNEGKWHIEVHFTDARAGHLQRHVPALQEGSSEELSEY